MNTLSQWLVPFYLTHLYRDFFRPILRGVRTRGASVSSTSLRKLLSRSPVTFVLPNSMVTSVPSSYLTVQQSCLTVFCFSSHFQPLLLNLPGWPSLPYFKCPRPTVRPRPFVISIQTLFFRLSSLNIIYILKTSKPLVPNSFWSSRLLTRDPLV